MDQAVQHLDTPMTVAQFLVWHPPENRMWQPANRTPMATASPSWGAKPLLGGIHKCDPRPFAGPGQSLFVAPNARLRHAQARRPLHVRSQPGGDVFGPCQRPDGHAGPVLVVEVLFPSNPAETWINVQTCTIMPSVQEVIVFHTASVRADLLRRKPDGEWPDNPEPVLEGDLVLQCIGLRTPPRDFDCNPPLHPDAAA